MLFLCKAKVVPDIGTANEITQCEIATFEDLKKKGISEKEFHTPQYSGQILGKKTLVQTWRKTNAASIGKKSDDEDDALSFLEVDSPNSEVLEEGIYTFWPNTKTVFVETEKDYDTLVGCFIVGQDVGMGSFDDLFGFGGFGL